MATDGGPAFPPTTFDGKSYAHGMSLRDYFAAKAMQALIIRGGYTVTPDVPLSMRSYEIADNLLAERAK